MDGMAGVVLAAAAGEDTVAPHIALLPAVTILAAGLAAILVARMTRLSAIIGFLIAGAVLGESGFGLVQDDATTHLLAELGVMFLLFDIGLHFSLRDIRDQGRDFLTLAPAQMAVCALALIMVARLLGMDWMMAVLIGSAFALSSTAVVARVLADRNLAMCPLGRSATTVLVFQDIIAIFLLVLVASMSAGGEQSLAASLGMAVVKAAIAFAAAVLLGRFVARPLFALLASTRNEEAFPAAALVIVLAAGVSTGAMGLSLTLGAFLAGMIIADTPYRHIIQTEVRPFRSLLMGFFFMAVGVSLNVPELLRSLHWVILGAVGLLAFKSGLVVLAARLSGWSRPGSIQLGTLLGQGSEFALVILAAPAVLGALDPQLSAILVAVIALTIAATPGWSLAGMTIARRLAARAAAHNEPTKGDAVVPVGPASPLPSETSGAQQRPVVVFGLTEVGRLTVDALTAHDLPVVAIDNDPDRFAQARADGYEATFGDAGDMRFLETVGVTNARAVVLGAPRYEVSRALTPYIAERFPDLVRFVPVADAADRDRHTRLGVRAHILEDEPKGLELALDVLELMDVDRDAMAEWETDARSRASDATPSLEGPEPTPEAA